MTVAISVIVFFLLPMFVFAISIEDEIYTLLDDLSAQYMEQQDDGALYSRQTISIVEIENSSPLAEENYIGQGVEEMLKTAIFDSLIFKYVDRRTLDIVVEEMKLALSGLMDEEKAPEIGEIEGVRLLLTGSVREDKDDFIITLHLIDVETTELTGSSSLRLPKEDLIEIGNRLAYEYVMANGLGLSFNATPHRVLTVTQQPMVAVGEDDKIHGGSGGGRLVYRLSRMFRAGLEINTAVYDVYHDNQAFRDARNFPADFLDATTLEKTFVGLWQSDGTLDTIGWGDTALDHPLYYTISQQNTSANLIFSFVYPVTREFNLSIGIGPSIGWIQLRQVYDSAPTVVGNGIAFLRKNIAMDFLSLGAAANIDMEYFFLPRMAVNLGASYIYSWVFPPAEIQARDPETGEYYYTSDNRIPGNLGLNPFMRPDGTAITHDMFSPNYLRVYLGFSVYF